MEYAVAMAMAMARIDTLEVRRVAACQRFNGNGLTAREHPPLMNVIPSPTYHTLVASTIRDPYVAEVVD